MPVAGCGFRVQYVPAFNLFLALVFVFHSSFDIRHSIFDIHPFGLLIFD